MCIALPTDRQTYGFGEERRYWFYGALPEIFCEGIRRIFFSARVKFYNFIANNEKFVDNSLLYCVCRHKERENFPSCILCGVPYLFMCAERLLTAHTLNNFFLRYRPRCSRGRYRFHKYRALHRCKIFVWIGAGNCGYVIKNAGISKTRRDQDRYKANSRWR